MAAGPEPGRRVRPLGRVEPLRVPTTTGRGGAQAKPRLADRPSLLLSVHRGVLGIELDAPFPLGPITVDDLALALPNVRFPVDLSGGVTRFRHRRGILRRLSITAEPTELSTFVAPRLRGVLGEGTPEIAIYPGTAGALVGMRLGDAALAFEVVIAPGERDVRLLPERARGVGLGAPPHVVAMRALFAACRPTGRVAGSAVVIPDAVASIVRDLLPAAGARAPAVSGARWEALEIEPGRLSLSIAENAAPPALPAEAIRALELAELAAEGDRVALAGDLDEARRHYLTALERAPRHPEISLRLAWIDVVAGERAEGALSTLVDAMPAVDAGMLGGELLAAVGDAEGAIAAFSRAAHAEPFGPLAALVWMRVAQLATEDLGVRLDALDQAVSRAPLLDNARWARLSARLDVGDAQGARADAENLEAAARGPEARHRIWTRAADAFLARGYVAEAGSLFERALRYAPDSAEAIAGLAMSLRAAGQGKRALDLLARASALATRAGRTVPSVELELARGLVEVAGDRPAAVARVRAVPPGVPESAEARMLEGRWRAELGDLAGASVALARLREAIELLQPVDPDRAAALAAMLVEAAEIEEMGRGDLRAAQRHLGVALRLRPRDRAIGAAFRRVAGEASRLVPPPPSPEELSTQTVSVAPVMSPPVDEVTSDESPSEEEDEVLVERLTDKLRANPDDHAVAMALAGALARLGRDLDLLALLSARIEEGGEAVRRELQPLRIEVLERLAAHARSEGRASEAELYEMMAASDG
ncbi:tetratricopeptide repeat protein [Polyangium aurulentum]|uniref:tetratricopeptide repeat protein n=1 Tax=Polyangium aurulentum TaxID=2567896 RepID=UPI0010AE86CB|nr:tetratricopeptide repeat protein [Polyangium aurulentum]UQA63290.1 hypothetical protein E8A73_023620 [Polyangium aurulentum]